MSAEFKAFQALRSGNLVGTVACRLVVRGRAYYKDRLALTTLSGLKTSLGWRSSWVDWLGNGGTDHEGGEDDGGRESHCCD